MAVTGSFAMRGQKPKAPQGGRSRSFLGTVLCALLLPGAAGLDAQVIDRMLAIVDGRVITLGDVRQQRELGRFFGDRVPEDDAQVLQDIIENMLIDDQIRQFIAIAVTESDVDAYLEPFGDRGDLPAERVREAARARLRRQEFFEARFGRFVEATPAEIEAYYENVFLPAARRQGLDPPPRLEGELLAEIERNVIIEKTDEAVSDWVGSLTRRSEIEVVE